MVEILVSLLVFQKGNNTLEPLEHACDLHATNNIHGQYNYNMS